MTAANNEFTHADSVSLKEFLQTKIGAAQVEIIALRDIVDERDRLYSTQFKSSETAVNAALAAAEKAVNAAFTASEKAIVKAEDAQKDYNVRSNEFRAQLDDQAKTLMPRNETVGLFKATDDKIVALQQRLEGNLVAHAASVEKSFDVIAKDVTSLRDSRSEVTGSKQGTLEQRTGLYALAGILLALAGLLAGVFLR